MVGEKTKLSADPLAVALWLSVTCDRPVLICVTVVPLGIPAPLTPYPIAKFAVLGTVIVVDPLVTLPVSVVLGVSGGGPEGAARVVVLMSV